MPSICFYFQIHQPYRVKKMRVFDVGETDNYFDEDGDTLRNNRAIAEKVARKSYIPMLRVLRDLLVQYPEFKFTFSISGVALQQFEAWIPEIIDMLRDLALTGRVEFLSETSHHSLSFLYSPKEFRKQVESHRNHIERLFGVTPTSFRNTELIYNNALAKEVEDMGFTAILAEGWDPLLGDRTPNQVYRAPNVSRIVTLVKNYRLSDDIAFRFSNQGWTSWPLTSEKFANWVHSVAGNGELINLFMDFETFGEHQWEDTGIFDFMRALPGAILKHPDFDFVTVTEAAQRYPVRGIYDAHAPVTWADTERDLTAWMGNPMQLEALRSVYALEEAVHESGDAKILEDWRKLQTSDHFYYMCTKYFADGDVHKYFSPFDTPYEAFVAYNNALADLRSRLHIHLRSK